MNKKEIIEVLENLPLTNLRLFNGDNVVCVSHADIVKEIDRLRTVRLSDIKPYQYFKHNKQILQLIQIDYLDQTASCYNHIKGEIQSLGQYQLVEPVKIEVVEISDC